MYMLSMYNYLYVTTTLVNLLHYMCVVCFIVSVCVQGVMISHDNLTWTARICAELYCVTNVSL